MKEKIFIKNGRRYEEIKTTFPEEGIWMVLNKNEGQTRVFKLNEIPQNSYINFEFLSSAGELANYIYRWCKENSEYTVIELSSAICNFFAEKQKTLLFETQHLIEENALKHEKEKKRSQDR